jgi:glycosyltransferase involved in cell wall biosynthesis
VDFASDQAAVTEPRYREALESVGVLVLFGPKAVLNHLMVHGAEYRSVILSRPEVARDYLPMVRALTLEANVIYDTVDLHWVRFARGSEVLQNADHLMGKAEHYRRLELANARCADVTVAITEEERAELIAAAPDLNVVVLPNIHELAASVPPFGERRDILFIGGFTHEPNVDAVLHFVTAIFPRVSQQLGDVRFNIIGSDMPPDIARLKAKNVEPMGFVPDVDPLFERARVFVAPLRHGAGMKGKGGHALSFGLPVVTTSIGAEGIGLVSGETALISDDPSAFGDMVVRLYSDEGLWSRLSSAGRGLIASRFSEEVVQDKLLAVVGATARP